MTSRGQVETEKLRKNLESQLERLVTQLADLEECKDDLEDSEYKETKEETMDQLREFNESLSRMISGDMTLVDELGSVQLATQAAISAAFKTPAVIRMFARREPSQLRQRLSELDRDTKLGKMSPSAISEKLEVLNALKQLREDLTPSELHFLEQNKQGAENATQFIQVSETSETGVKALELAGLDVRSVINKK